MKNFKVCALMAALTVCAAGCSDDKDDNNGGGSTITGGERMYILNQGSMDANNANISLYFPSTGDFTANYFTEQNGRMLGDTAQEMIQYNGYIYVALFGSNYLYKLDKDLKIVAQLALSNYEELQGGVRSIAAEDGFIYASFYGGVIAKINAGDLSISGNDGILKGVGSNLEELVIEDDKLYVADSYSITTDPSTGAINYNYLKEIKVVDLNTFSLAGSIEVVENPNDLLEEEGKIFLISCDYSDISYPVQMIDPKTETVTKIGYATCFASNDGIVYMVDSRTDYSTNPYTTTNSFWSYDVKNGTVNNNSFLKNAPEDFASANIYMIEIDDETGDIYISSTFYTAYNGNIYHFKADGTYVGKFDCGGQNPIGALFIR